MTWLYKGLTIRQNPEKYEITEAHVSDRRVKSLLKIINLEHRDNGSYICHSENSHDSDTAVVEAVVYDTPEVVISHIVAVSSSKLFINWTVNDWNSPVSGYILSYREDGDNQWRFHLVSRIDAGSTSYLMSNLSKSKEYTIKMAAKNRMGPGRFDTYVQPVSTLDFDPHFVPEVSIKGITKNSISVGWNDPPEKVSQHIHYYKVTKKTGDSIAEVIHQLHYPLHLWGGLVPATK